MKSLGVFTRLYPSPAVDLTSPKRAKAQLGSIHGQIVAAVPENRAIPRSATDGAATRRIVPNFNLG
ncbi:hypothetical protein [Caulobacter sp. 1776]|uniref:hypothetical protein n=1 Tax=Caulobacter sp. 1776 TaxID=3156420 RepID=UPI003396CA1E